MFHDLLNKFFSKKNNPQPPATEAPIAISVDTTLLTGKVKFYDPKNKFGFVRGDDGIDRFFNEKQLKEDTVVTGARVTFRHGVNDRGAMAKSIRLL